MSYLIFFIYWSPASQCYLEVQEPKETQEAGILFEVVDIPGVAGAVQTPLLLMK